jgi:hypothetical protein
MAAEDDSGIIRKDTHPLMFEDEEELRVVRKIYDRDMTSYSPSQKDKYAQQLELLRPANIAEK